MDNEDFDRLLKRPESDVIDFKAGMYEFGGPSSHDRERKRAAFVKDIICMANTPREQSAHIVLGVRKLSDASNELTGLSSHVDENELQQQLGEWVYPHPRLLYEPVSYQGRQFAVIELPVDRVIGPFFSLKNVDNMIHSNQLYHRHGSRNSEADAYWQGVIWDWFRDAERYPTLAEDGTPPWNEFVRAVEGFDSGRRYVLIISRYDAAANAPLANLGLIHWSLVVDLDPDSETSGVLSQCRTTIQSRRALHRVTKGDTPTLNLAAGTYWYFARGMSGRESTISVGKFKDWQRDHAKELDALVESLAAAIAFQPITVVVLAEDPALVSHIHSILGRFNARFGETSEVVLVSSSTDEFKRVALDFEAKVLTLPFHHLCHGLKALQEPESPTSPSPIVLPSSSDAPIELSPTDSLWLREELELVHRGVGFRPLLDIVPGRDFLRGRESEISWYELGLQCDVARDVADAIRKDIRTALERRRIRRINLYHAPGAGGTTLARRVLWDFRNEYPSTILAKTTPLETAERLAHVYALTGLPILLNLDGSSVSERQSDELFEVIAARQIPVVMFQVLRRSRPPGGREPQHNLSSTLSDLEFARFVHHLATYVPEKRIALERVAASQNANDRSPFYLGLVAFERDFLSIEGYVRARLQDLSPVQARTLQFLALAQYYGQKPMPQQAFAQHLGVPLSRRVKLESHIPDPTLQLLVETEPGYWRVTHHLIAEEILIQTLTPANGDRRLWKQNLPDCSVAFADLCHGPLPDPNEAGLELARRVFVYRDNSDLLGTEHAGERGDMPLFAQLIGDIGVSEAKLRVLQHLTDVYPDEAHFWAHLGRLYSLELKQFDNAVEAIDKGIQLQPDDHVLHHMRGMAFRSTVYWLIEQGSDISAVIAKARLASEAFSRARALQPVDEHGYISEAQMIVRVLNYCSKARNTSAIDVAANSEDPWLRESFQAVEELLNSVRMSRIGAHKSEFELRCRADLNVLYGKHEEALQTWDNLLARRDNRGRSLVFAPPIRRQIVWTLLSSRNRQWANLTRSQIDRCSALLEQNLHDEPNDDRNLRLWIQAARFQSTPPSVEAVLEKVAYWKSNSSSLDAAYYLFVLNAIQAISGYPLSRDSAERALEECRKNAKYRRDRTRSYEWLGKEPGIRQLVHQSALGEWDPKQDFWRSTGALQRLKGVIVSIKGPEAGWIETPGGLKAFFVPAGGSQRRSQPHDRSSTFAAGKSENQAVSYFLGFSYDGLRAWSVEES
jgi:tetratricopeptide (TPR) repeat protein